MKTSKFIKTLAAAIFVYCICSSVDATLLLDSGTSSAGESEWVYTNGAVRPNQLRDVAPFGSNSTDLGTSDSPFRTIRGTTMIGSTIYVDRIFMNAESIEFNPSVLVDVGELYYDMTNTTYRTLSNSAGYITFTVSLSETGPEIAVRKMIFGSVTNFLRRYTLPPNPVTRLVTNYKYYARVWSNQVWITGADCIGCVTNYNDVTTNSYVVSPGAMVEYAQSVIASNPVDVTRYTTSSINTNVFAGSAAFSSIVTLKDGRLFFVPYASTSARIYDPATGVMVTPTNAFPGANHHFAGCLLQDGRVFLSAFNNLAVPRIFDPYAGTLVTANSSGFTWINSTYGLPIVLQDGRVFIPPLGQNGGIARIYDPVSDRMYSANCSSSAFELSYACLMRDGRVFMSPHTGYAPKIYDPVIDQTTIVGGAEWGGNSFGAPVLLPDGRIFVVAGNSTTSRIYDPVSGNTVITAAGWLANQNYIGILLPDGRVFTSQHSLISGSTLTRIYDPATDSVQVTTNGIAALAQAGLALVPDGRIFSAPYNATTSWRIIGPVYTNNFKLEYLLTPERNRF